MLQQQLEAMIIILIRSTYRKKSLKLQFLNLSLTWYFQHWTNEHERSKMLGTIGRFMRWKRRPRTLNYKSPFISTYTHFVNTSIPVHYIQPTFDHNMTTLKSDIVTIWLTSCQDDQNHQLNIRLLPVFFTQHSLLLLSISP